MVTPLGVVPAVGELIVMDIDDDDTVALTLSVIRSVMPENTPATVGVPLITQLVMVMPDGKAPACNEQVYGAVPPAATTLTGP